MGGSNRRSRLYNRRSELAGAVIGTNVFTHAYDEIGNQVLGGVDAVTNTFVANSLNQRVSVHGASAPPRELAYAADGGLANDGRFAYAYDAEDRLASVTSLALTNGAVRVRNEYDWRSRRVAKCVDRYDAGAEEWRPAERHDFVWDNWNIVHETVSTFAGAATNVTEVQYFWGPDLSGTFDGAGGVGGLLAVSRDGNFYFPAYDNNGNIVKYIDESGSVAAAYVYDDFGKIVSQTDSLADSFSFRFSTKYLDCETGTISYQLRCYKPEDEFFLNRDPIEETGGFNLYQILGNRPIDNVDALGEAVYIVLAGLEDSENQIFAILQENLASALRSVQSTMNGLDKVSNKQFECLKKGKKVWFNGQLYNGSFEEYKARVSHELNSVIRICRSYRESVQEMTSMVKTPSRDWDILTYLVHGGLPTRNYSRTFVKFSEGMYDQHEVLNAISGLMSSAKGVRQTISCYQTWDGVSANRHKETVRIQGSHNVVKVSGANAKITFSPIKVVRGVK